MGDCGTCNYEDDDNGGNAVDDGGLDMLLMRTMVLTLTFDLLPLEGDRCLLLYLHLLAIALHNLQSEIE